MHSYIKLTRRMVKDFGALPKENIVKPRVGLVGEILVKYHPNANNNAVEPVSYTHLDVYKRQPLVLFHQKAVFFHQNVTNGNK